jgi:acyl carrier protein
MVRVSSSAGADEVAAAITAFVNANIMALGHPVAPDDEFSTAGVDSMGLLKVLLFIEAEFGLWIPDEDLVDGNVRSPRALAGYLCRQRTCS